MPDIFVDQQKHTNSTKTAKTAKKVVKNIPTEAESTEPSIQEKSKTSTLWQRIKQPLTAYVVNPPKMHFESQEEEEQVILLLRKHPITNIPWIVSGVLMLLAPIVIFPLFSFLNPFPNLPLTYQFVFTLFWYVVTFGVILANYLSWFFNIYLVTTERIVDVDFRNLVYRQLSSTRVARVQDVTYKVSGVIRSIFDYGDVFIQTAGTEENFVFEAAPKPQEVVKTIGELTDKKEEDGV